jgi:hypothetical protein
MRPQPLLPYPVLPALQRFAPADAIHAKGCSNYAKFCGGDIQGIIE